MEGRLTLFMPGLCRENRRSFLRGTFAGYRMHRLYTPYPPKKHVTTGVRVGVPFSSRDVIIRYECEQLSLNHFFLYAETGLWVLVGLFR